MKLYKIRGTSEWVPWDVLYNERGYNSVPCIDMAYKSISPWGTSAGSGYRTNSAGDATYFVFGKTGWWHAFNLPQALGVYPDEATPIQMIKDGVISDAVWMEFWGAKWYLIQAEIANERYWIIEQGLSELGWEIYEGKDYEFILVDGTTGRVVHGVEQLNEMVFAPTGYFTIEDTGDIVFVEQSPYPIVSCFHVDFDTVQTLADGAYIDTVLPYYTSKLYIAGIVDRVSETVVDFGLTVSNEGGYVRVTNNTGASVTLTRLVIQSMDAAGAEVVEVVDGQDNHAYAFKWDDGTPYWWISYSGERHWTDTLGNWSEVPSVVLPTVSTITIYTNSENHFYQEHVTNTTTEIVTAYTYDLYTDQLCTESFLYDSNSLYIVGRIVNGVWTKYTIQSVSDMPSSEATSLSNATVGRILLSNGKIWYVINTGISYSTTQWSGVCKVCSSNQASVITVYNSSNVAYNAFKFTANNTDYYYVLDGTQTNWADDLSSIGYSLTPTLVLPTVVKDGYVLYGTSDIRSITIASGETHDLYEFGEGKKPFDTSKSYATDRWQQYSAYTRDNVTNLQIVNNSGYFAVNNTSSSAITNFVCIVIATCSSNQAAVITVYNSSNVAYNSFKFTANNTNYYYVLDGTQTDWTDDLSSIGYHYGYIDVLLGLRYDPSNSDWKSVAFDQTPTSTDNYWWACVLNQNDANTLQSFGLNYHDPSSIWSGQKFTGPIGNVVYDSNYSYEFLALYSDMGETEAAQGIWSGITLDYVIRDNNELLVIWSKTFTSSTLVKTWKCRITKL